MWLEMTAEELCAKTDLLRAGTAVAVQDSDAAVQNPLSCADTAGFGKLRGARSFSSELFVGQEISEREAVSAC
jgi:hypothetical protein